MQGTILSVSKSGYYIWLKRPPSERQIENRRLEVEIEAAHRRTRGYLDPIDYKKNYNPTE